MKFEVMVDIASSIITTIATVGLAVITWYYARLTKHLVKVPNTPEIAIDMEPDETYNNYDHGAYLCVENVGTGSAYNVQFQTDLSFICNISSSGETTLETVGFIKNGINYLAPGKKRRTWIELTGRFEELKSTPLEIAFSYEDLEKEIISRCRRIDFGELVGSEYVF